MNRCVESEKLILAVADDDCSLLQRRVALLIGARFSLAAVMVDMSQASASVRVRVRVLKIRAYTEKEKATPRLAAHRMGGGGLLKVATHGGILAACGTTTWDMKF